MASTRNTFVAAFATLIFGSFAAAAEVTEEPSLGESQVLIVNRGKQEVKFSLRPNNGAWSEYALSGNQSTRITCNQCSTNSFEIIISTDGRQIDKAMPSGGRYYIDWDGENMRWDVYTAQ